MINTMLGQKQQSFFKKYKTWIVALIGVQLIPVILLSILFGGTAIYLFANNDSNFHPYKSYIEKGFRIGYDDGTKSYDRSNEDAARLALHTTPWRVYESQTDILREKATLEKKEYLAQFPESERGAKLAEMKLNNIKLPLQFELDKRFTSGLGFYADHVKQRVDRGNFLSDAEYHKALEGEAWKVGYAFGYREGLAGYSYNMARLSLDY